jgi:hypothetical protein
MPATRCLHCTFAESIHAKVLAEQPHEKTVLIFPTEISKKQAQRLFQSQWRFTDTLFHTMEEFKELLFPGTVPVLKEEKRTLALYASLAPSVRKRFKMQNYFQSIEWAHHFFAFWEECTEENVPESTVLEKLLHSGCELQEWQKELYELLLSVKTHYGDFIHGKGYEDILFSHRTEKADFAFFVNYARFVFVNQYYYTASEKEFIARLDQAGKETVIYYQMPSRFIKWPDMEPQSFSFSQLAAERNQNVTIREARNELSMMAALSQELADNDEVVIIDPNPQQNAYYRFLSLQHIALHMSFSFQQTCIYRFFNHLYGLLDSVILDSEDHLQLLPLQSLLDVMTDSTFYGYFCPDSTRPARHRFCEQGCLHLYTLIEQDFKYIDLEGHFFRMPHAGVKAIQPFVEPILALLQRLARVKDMSQLLDLIDQQSGLDIKMMLNEYERSYSDILDVFYQTLADFSGLDAVGLVDDWHACFIGDAPHAELAMSRSWLRFFLEYFKPQRVHYSTQDMHTSRVEITNLLDTRNIDYKHIALVNMQEGILPRAPQTPFLFNETQRRFLGLKTYEQVRLREKYYLARLLCTTPRVDLYCIKNTDRNIEVSSFVEEVGLFWDREKLYHQEVSDESYRAIYEHLLPAAESRTAGRLSSAFFAIPFERHRDFPEKVHALSFYQYQALREQPFMYYIRHLLGFQPRATKVEMNFTPLLLGRLAHEILNTMWKLFIEDTSALPGSLSWLELYQRFAQPAFDQVLKMERYARYRIPKNHTLTYFEQVQWPMLQRGMNYLFTYLAQDLALPSGQTRVYPESQFSNRTESEGQPFATVPYQEGALSIYLAGRADLRLENPSPPAKMIFDYKTGSIDATQLLFYEWLYYRSRPTASADPIYSYGCDLIKSRIQELAQLSSRRGKPVSKTELLAELADGITSLFLQLERDGFIVQDKKYVSPDWRTILRQDLLREYDSEQ